MLFDTLVILLRVVSMASLMQNGHIHQPIRLLVGQY